MLTNKLKAVKNILSTYSLNFQKFPDVDGIIANLGDIPYGEDIIKEWLIEIMAHRAAVYEGATYDHDKGHKVDNKLFQLLKEFEEKGFVSSAYI